MPVLFGMRPAAGGNSSEDRDQGRSAAWGFRTTPRSECGTNAGRQQSGSGVKRAYPTSMKNGTVPVRSRAAARQCADAETSESGQTTILTALMLGTFLLGFVALAVDVAYFYQQKRAIQAAADAAAVAAAEEASYGNTDESAAAQSSAKRHGFNPKANKHAATVSVRTPTAGNYAGNSAYIEVDVSQPVSTIFLNILHTSTLTVSARAVASAGQSSPTCVCLEGPSGTDLAMSNGSTINLTGCGITVDSNGSNAVTIAGGAYVSASSIGSISTNWDNGSNVNNGGKISSTTKVVQGISTACKPTLPTAPAYNTAQCTADPLSHYGNGGSSYSIGPGSTYSTTQGGDTVCYNSLTVGTNGDKVNLNPGIYVINGGTLHFMSGSGGTSNTGGDGVFFYLTGNASLVIDNGANVNIAPATSGTYSGMLIFQDPSDTQSVSVQGGSKMNISGTIFAPSANVTLGNGSNTSVGSDIVAYSMTVNGGGKLVSTPTTNLGTLNISVAKLSE